jgi:disulfide bond formation protein DsbB
MRSALDERAGGGLLWVAFAVAAGGLAGSLSLSMALALRACPLCFYQRTFMMGAAAVLAVGLLLGDTTTPRRLGLLALPLALGGLGVAVFHVLLEWRGELECPAGVLGLGTAPQQSLAFFALLAIVLSVAALAGDEPVGKRLLEFGGVLVVGAVLTVASLVANPPMPPRPPTAAAQPRDICWPPPAH